MKRPLPDGPRPAGAPGRSPVAALAMIALPLAVGAVLFLLVWSGRHRLGDGWALPCVIAVELLPFAIHLAVRRTLAGAAPLRGPVERPGRRWALLAGVLVGCLGLAALLLGGIIAAGGTWPRLLLVAGGVAFLAGCGVIALCVRFWGGRYVLGEFLRNEEPEAAPIGGEPVHVRVLALLFGAVAAGFGLWGGLRNGDFEGRPTTLLLVAAALIGVGIAAFVKAGRRKGGR